MKKLNAFQLKSIALVVMFMDHLYFTFSDVFPLWFHPLSRFVAPLFGYFLVEGFFFTRNRLKYNVRVLSWGIVMGVGNFILNKTLGSKDVHISYNIFLTLALGLAIINLLELGRKNTGKKKLGIILLAILLVPLCLFTEGGTSLIPFILITYFFKDKRKIMFFAYFLLSALLFFTAYTKYDTINETINMLMFNSDFLLICVIPFILLYNGERGPNTKFNKYLFYVFYPLHIWLLAIAQFIIK